MKKKNIAVFVGSLRKESFNKKLAQYVMDNASKDLNFQLIDISRLPMYNQDLDKNPPTEWTDMRNQVKEMDGLLFVTPEYNRSVPGVLKNAIDVASRPHGKNIFDKKPAAVISVTIGNTGAFGANHHLRQSLTTLNAPTLQQPEMYISHAEKLFNDKGELVDGKTQESIAKFSKAFNKWVTQHDYTEEL